MAVVGNESTSDTNPRRIKAIIAKAVANMSVVKKALENGIVCIPRGTTNAFIVEEISGEKIEKGKFASGIITPNGMCNTAGKLEEVAFVKGKVQREISITAKLIHDMDSDDVIIKGANALDSNGNSAVYFGNLKGGGLLGRTILIAMTRGVNLIIPVGLEKLVSIPVSLAAKETGITRIDYSMGMPVSLIPLIGEVVTEVEAIKILSGAETIHIGSGGIGGAEGSVVLIIKGSEEQVHKAVKFIKECKGEKAIKAFRQQCSKCSANNMCPNKKVG